VHQSIFSSRLSSMFRRNSRTRSSDPWTPSPPSSRVLSQLVSPNVSSHLALRADTTSWQLCSLSRRATTLNSTACRLSTARTGASTHARFSCRKVKESRLASPSRSRSSDRWRPAPRSCTRTCFTLATRMCVPSTPRILVSHYNCTQPIKKQRH
jgi:hypothetical protein